MVNTLFIRLYLLELITKKRNQNCSDTSFSNPLSGTALARIGQTIYGLSSVCYFFILLLIGVTVTDLTSSLTSIMTLFCHSELSAQITKY